MRPLSAQGLRAWEAFAGVVAQARDASTVVLVRHADAGPEVFLLRRQTSMTFAGGMHVFPGGGTQGSDAEEIPWCGPPPEDWARAFGCSAEVAHTLVVAAVRETFEETGVLLAGPDRDTVAGAGAVPDSGVVRSAMEREEVSLREMLIEHGLVLRADLLSPWAHWITPDFEPRRFDTRFFVALLPDGQEVGDLAGEADGAQWHALSDVVARARAGELAMMPPTLHVCRRLDGVAIDGVREIAWRRPVPTVAPRAVLVDGRPCFDFPPPEEF